MPATQRKKGKARAAASDGGDDGARGARPARPAPAAVPFLAAAALAIPVAAGVGLYYLAVRYLGSPREAAKVVSARLGIESGDGDDYMLAGTALLLIARLLLPRLLSLVAKRAEPLRAPAALGAIEEEDAN
mmetsp:Transcript_11057/g.33004  ORF Transcript_11057/g.33004 Transcript_11057/m.33004 type:complete len:131 (+) Transcript_11057:148-540(+)